MPALSGQASAMRQRISENAIPVPPGSGGGGFGLPGSEFNTFRIGFDAAWELDLFGRTRRGIEAARGRTGAAIWNRRDVQGSVAADIVELYEPLAESAGIQLTLEPSPALTIAGDSDLLIELAANLVDNAIKFTPAGGAVRVAVLAAAPGGDGGPVLRVDDFEVAWDDADHTHGHAEFFVVRLPHFEVVDDDWTDDERVDIVASRWWTLDELDATADPVEPVDLADVVRAALTRSA